VTTWVIDASVAIKWVVDEPGTEQALLLRRHHLVAPDLLIAECANILWKKVRRKELSEAEAILAARLLQRTEVELEPMRGLLEPATKLAIALGHPAYDCTYLALAEARSCAMVTADDQLYRRTLAIGFEPKVVRLAAIRE